MNNRPTIKENYRTTFPVNRRGTRRLTRGKKDSARNTRSEVRVCANCSTRFRGVYCNVCGQHFDTKRLTTRELWDNITFSLVNFERGIPNTLKRLFSRPGQMIKEYIDGHRVSYSHPVAMLILLCTVYGIVMGLIHAALSGYDGTEASQTILGDVDTDGDRGGLRAALQFLWVRMSNSVVLGALLPVPFFAWAARRLFRRYGSREYNYAEMLFMGLYMACQRMAVSLVIQPFIAVYPDVEILPWIKNGLYVFIAAWSFRGIFPTVKWRPAIWKSILMFLLGWTMMVLIIILLAFLAVGVVALVGWISGMTIS